MWALAVSDVSEAYIQQFQHLNYALNVTVPYWKYILTLNIEPPQPKLSLQFNASHCQRKNLMNKRKLHVEQVHILENYVDHDILFV